MAPILISVFYPSTESSSPVFTERMFQTETPVPFLQSHNNNNKLYLHDRQLFSVSEAYTGQTKIVIKTTSIAIYPEDWNKKEPY